VAIALMEAGEQRAASKAVTFLELGLDDIDDPYTTAIVSYALELADSNRAGAAYDKLMSMSVNSGDGLSWGTPQFKLGQTPAPRALGNGHSHSGNRVAAVETTGYATLALLERGDLISAANAGKWLVNQRNAYGGYGSTQDTVVGLQAMTKFAANARYNVDMTVDFNAGNWSKRLTITPDNADVLQIVEAPAGATIEVSGQGEGQVVVQAVRRFNMPTVVNAVRPVFDIDVDYGTDHVDVDDLITISADVTFNPPEFVEAGMVVLDVAIPTGFSPVAGSIDRMAEAEPRIKRHDVAGRKVIIYIEDMAAGETLSVEFQARAVFPVRAEPVTSAVYSYYRPEWRGQALGGAMKVEG
jgi:CD109 antigen